MVGIKDRQRCQEPIHERVHQLVVYKNPDGACPIFLFRFRFITSKQYFDSADLLDVEYVSVFLLVTDDSSGQIGVDVDSGGGIVSSHIIDTLGVDALDGVDVVAIDVSIPNACY